MVKPIFNDKIALKFIVDYLANILFRGRWVKGNEAGCHMVSAGIEGCHTDRLTAFHGTNDYKLIVLLTHWHLGNLKKKNRLVTFKPNLLIDGWSISCEIALMWFSMDLTDDISALVQVIAWCCQASSHYLSQCWLWSMSPYGITRLQCVKISIPVTSC